MPGTTTSFQWAIQPVSLGSVTIHAARLEIEVFLHSMLPGMSLLCEQAWIDTGAPLSVAPYQIHIGRLDWKPIPGVQLSWANQPCDLGTIDLWLPTQETPGLRGPIPLLAKFPRSDPPGISVPILLGLEFFLTNQAVMRLEQPSQQSAIWLP
jgi:hypothetical protein